MAEDWHIGDRTRIGYLPRGAASSNCIANRSGLERASEPGDDIHALGGVAVFSGLFILDVGTLPMALLANGFKEMWSTFWQLILLLVLTGVFRSYTFHLDRKWPREKSDATTGRCDSKTA
ncbi:MAG: hypothetical protein JWR21_1823 [Herminiimonas sp.]|nr:hypothetical protein [Herminiimonas sp.]